MRKRGGGEKPYYKSWGKEKRKERKTNGKGRRKKQEGAK